MDREGLRYAGLGFGLIAAFILGGFLVGGWLALLLPFFSLPGQAAFAAAGWTVGVAGFALVYWATAAFGYYGHGTPLPQIPPKRLVTRGPYRHIRSPIYVGWFLGWGGLGVATGNLLYCGLGLFLLVAGTAYARRGERPALAGKFGPEFERWVTATPEFVPRVRR